MPSKGRQVVIILRVWFLFSWSVFLAGELPVFSALAGFEKENKGQG
jgi:hypothetical protein